MTTNRENTPQEPQDETFLEATEKAKGGLIAEFFEFMGENAKWWLAPILVVFLLLGVLLIFAGSAITPFLYTLF